MGQTMTMTGGTPAGDVRMSGHGPVGHEPHGWTNALDRGAREGGRGPTGRFKHRFEPRVQRGRLAHTEPKLHPAWEHLFYCCAELLGVGDRLEVTYHAP